jgi:hypothetical protein
MLELFKDGGFPMFFVVGFGLIALVTALLYAIRPKAEREGFITAMSGATLFSTLSGVCADFIAVAHHVATHEIAPDKLTPLLVEGFGESMSPCIFGFSMLSLVCLMVAVGRRRLEV